MGCDKDWKTCIMIENLFIKRKSIWGQIWSITSEKLKETGSKPCTTIWSTINWRKEHVRKLNATEWRNSSALIKTNKGNQLKVNSVKQFKKQWFLWKISRRQTKSCLRKYKGNRLKVNPVQKEQNIGGSFGECSGYKWRPENRLQTKTWKRPDRLEEIPKNVRQPEPKR